MSKKIAIINQKGGVGKSTTAEALAAGLSLKGFSVLAIDLGAQGNMTYTFDAKPDGITALEVLTQKATAQEAIQHTNNGDIIPAQADIYSLQGIEQLSETMKPVKKYCNPALKVDGILLTRSSSRSVLSRDIADLANQLAAKIGTKVFQATIREAIAVKEAQISQQSLFKYAPKAKVANDYAAFIDEMLRGE